MDLLCLGHASPFDNLLLRLWLRGGKTVSVVKKEERRKKEEGRLDAE